MPRSAKSKIPWAVADFETNPFEPGVLIYEPFVVGYFNGTVLEIFWGTGRECCLWLIAKSKKYPGIIFLHNGGNFDMHLMLEYLPCNECEFFTIGKRIVQLKTPWGAEFRDSYAIIPKPQAAFVDGKTPIDYMKFRPQVRERHRTEIISYLKDDLRGLYNGVEGFIKRFPLCLTLASSIFKLMKTDFGIKPVRMDAGFDSRFRPYFFGGRVQFFQLGRCIGPHHLIDVNSMYPAAMTKPHWSGPCSKVTSVLPKTGLEQCLLDVTCLSLGVFPLRKENGGIDFPCAEGRYLVTGWELAYGLESGRVSDLEVKYCFHPESRTDFSPFVHHFYNGKVAAKLAGDSAEEFFMKIGLNTGFGKYAIDPTRYREVHVSEFGEMPETPVGYDWSPEELQWDDPDRGLSFWARKSYQEGIDQFVNVATAASITGCARAMLLRAMDQCEGVKYCDTDSIVAESIAGLPLSNDLGEWKHEETWPGTQPYVSPARPGNSFYIAGKKLYAGFSPKRYLKDLENNKKGKNLIKHPGWKKACKGVDLPPKLIVNVAMGKEQTVTSKAPTFSVFSETRFVRRKIRRADKM